MPHFSRVFCARSGVFSTTLIPLTRLVPNLFLPPSPIVDPNQSLLAIRVGAETAPPPVVGVLRQSADHRIPVHIFRVLRGPGYNDHRVPRLRGEIHEVNLSAPLGMTIFGGFDAALKRRSSTALRAAMMLRGRKQVPIRFPSPFGSGQALRGAQSLKTGSRSTPSLRSVPQGRLSPVLRTGSE